VVCKFDFDAPAELYPGRNRKSTKCSYRRFEKASVPFVLRSKLPELLLLGTCIEIDEQRLDHKDIQASMR
jgi:hypothetical protein